MIEHQILEPEQKALEINLNEKIYGTFAEIGAGQEVARYFFQVGAAVGTVAKTMSAYDKTFSDIIYGRENKGRYVCESRLYKMLDHEYDLMVNRLQKERPGTNFFVFSDTVAAVNYSNTIKGNGWLGVRFQLHSESEPNEFIIHVKLLDKLNHQQQQAIGILGVNLLYASYYYHENVEQMLISLMDNLKGRVAIDMARISGPDFQDLDSRWLSLLLVKNNLTDIAIFGPDGRNLHASEFLYRKSLLIVRGNFLPPTKVNMDMLESGFRQFVEEEDVDKAKAMALVEITINNLFYKEDTVKKDFLDRANLLCALGQTVIISNCEERSKLVEYFEDFKVNKIGLVIGVHELRTIFTQNTYNKNDDGKLLISLGRLFSKNTKIYGYPIRDMQTKRYVNCNNIDLPDGMIFLFSHLLKKGRIEDIYNVDMSFMKIFSGEVHEMILNNDPAWEEMVPEKVADLIKEQNLFGFNPKFIKS